MTKREQLQKILDRLKAGKISDKELKTLHITSVDGSRVALTSPEAIAAIEARIAALDVP